LMRPAGFIWVWLREPRGAGGLDMRDIGIELLIEGHDPAYRPDREFTPTQQTPDTELPGIGMPFLELINRHHHGQPLGAWRLWTWLFVLQAGQMVGFKARNPSINGGTRHVEHPADALFVPPLIVELHHAEAGGRRVGVGMIREEVQLRLDGCRTLLPVLLYGVMMNAIPKRTQENPRQFAIMKTRIEAFETRQLLDYDFWHPGDRATRPLSSEQHRVEQRSVSLIQLHTRLVAMEHMARGISHSGLSLAAISPHRHAQGIDNALPPQGVTESRDGTMEATRHPSDGESCVRGSLL
jgi:hypothetical protein